MWIFAVLPGHGGADSPAILFEFIVHFYLVQFPAGIPTVPRLWSPQKTDSYYFTTCKTKAYKLNARTAVVWSYFSDSGALLKLKDR